MLRRMSTAVVIVRVVVGEEKVRKLQLSLVLLASHCHKHTFTRPKSTTKISSTKTSPSNYHLNWAEIT